MNVNGSDMYPSLFPILEFPQYVAFAECPNSYVINN